MGLCWFQTLLLSLLTVIVLGTGQEDVRPLVDTKYGKLRGITLSIKEASGTVDAFFGVPFAKPPVGPLRFANPEPPVPWGSTREASEYPPMCLQQIDIAEGIAKMYKSPFKMPPLSEDCLYLNVFTPTDRARDSKLPVLVFIHGGGFMSGGASIYDGSALSSYGNVVLVSIQYRLAILGFFSTGDDQLHGDYGLLDQVAALQWIQENIADFGGDPQSVTIFGESAGGVSVAALVLSPLSQGLFHRAISESGVMTMSSLVVSKPENVLFYRNTVAHLSGCDPTTVADCLREKSQEEILSITSTLLYNNNRSGTAHNRIDGFLPLPGFAVGIFFPKPPEEILADKESNRVPYLLGMNNQEFGWVMPQAFNLTSMTMSREFIQMALTSIPFLDLSSIEIPFVMDEYIGDTQDPSELRDRLLDLCGDILFVVPSVRTARYHRDSGLPVYFYEFQHRPSLFKDIKPDYVKADHSDELIYVLGGPFLRDGVIFAGDATDEEKALSRTMMSYWANFARHGDPNGPGLVEWPQYDADEHYLEIDLRQKASTRLKDDRIKFWTEILGGKIQTLSDERGDRTEL